MVVLPHVMGIGACQHAAGKEHLREDPRVRGGAAGAESPAARRRPVHDDSRKRRAGLESLYVLRTASGREPKAQMKLSELFANCNPGVIQMLKGQFKNCPDSDPNANFTCNSTVADVVERVCGF